MSSPARIYSIDTFRPLAILAVICIHTGLFLGTGLGPGVDMLGFLLNSAAHVAVSFFFLATGYFLARKVAAGENPIDAAWNYTTRLLTVLAFWSIVYVAIPNDLAAVAEHGYLRHTRMKIMALLADPTATLIFDGSRSHLWFITALLVAVWQIAILVFSDRADRLPYWALFLYVVGLLGGSYATTPLGLNMQFNTRNGPFFSTLMVTLGWCLANPRIRVRLRWAALLAAAGFLLSVAEALLLWKFLDVLLVRHDFLIGTVPFAAGLFLVLLAKPELGKGTVLPRLAKYTFGIYACHVVFVDRWYSLKPLSPGLPVRLAIEIGTPLVIFFLSWALVLLMSRSRILSPLVMVSSAGAEPRTLKLLRASEGTAETPGGTTPAAAHPAAEYPQAA
jgi:surface polysaccharide O-acyltransferase-like enzyme